MIDDRSELEILSRMGKIRDSGIEKGTVYKGFEVKYLEVNRDLRIFGEAEDLKGNIITFVSKEMNKAEESFKESVNEMIKFNKDIL